MIPLFITYVYCNGPGKASLLNYWQQMKSGGRRVMAFSLCTKWRSHEAPIDSFIFGATQDVLVNISGEE